MSKAWMPPPPPTGADPVVAVDPGVDATHQVNVLPVPVNPPPPLGWSYRNDKKTPVTPDEQAFTSGAHQYPIGTFVQKIIGGKLVGVRLEWHDRQGRTNKRGCFIGANLMDPTPIYFALMNRSMNSVTLKTDPAPTGASWPQSVAIGKREKVVMTAPNGSATYSFGDSTDVTITWAPGSNGPPQVKASSSGVRMLVWVFTPAEVDDTTAAESPADETEQVPAGGQTDAARLNEATPDRPPKAAAQNDRGFVVFYESVRVRVDNQSGKELALISTNVGVEIDTLGIWDVAGANVQPPPTIAVGATQEWEVYTYPRAFADYGINDSDWKSCWLCVTWGAGGVKAAAHAHAGASAFLRSTLTKDPTPGPNGEPVMVARVDPGPRNAPVAPVNATTTNKYVTMKNPNDPADGESRGAAGNNPARQVLGVDVSSYQTMDFKKLSDLVDSQGRRAWFVGVKCSEGYHTDLAFPSHWKKLSQTRFLRMPYIFLDPLRVGSGATDRQLRAEADKQFDVFKSHYLGNGGYRPYDLPPAIDFEPVYVKNKRAIPPSQTSPQQRRDAWTLLPVMQTFIARLTAMFHHPPVLYSGASFFTGWYPVAKLGFAQERPGETWQDSWLAPIFNCLVWHSAMPWGATPTTDPGPNPTTHRRGSWPWPEPAGHTGPWFQGDWNFFQFAVTEIADTADPPDLPDVDSKAFGALRTTVHRHGIPRPFSTNGRLDINVWNGTLDQLVAVALATRWDRHA